LKCNPLLLEIVVPILARNDWRGALYKLMPFHMSSFPDLLDIDQGDMIREMNFSQFRRRRNFDLKVPVAFLEQWTFCKDL
jgi:hypothetical protein